MSCLFIALNTATKLQTKHKQLGLRHPKALKHHTMDTPMDELKEFKDESPKIVDNFQATPLTLEARRTALTEREKAL